MPFRDRSDRIDHSGPQLLWRQVADDIAEEIGSGALSSGDRLPSELDLAACYGVSRITVRRALKELRENRLVRAVQGRGTYVEATK